MVEVVEILRDDLNRFWGLPTIKIDWDFIHWKEGLGWMFVGYKTTSEEHKNWYIFVKMSRKGPKKKLGYPRHMKLPKRLRKKKKRKPIKAEYKTIEESLEISRKVDAMYEKWWYKLWNWIKKLFK